MPTAMQAPQTHSHGPTHIPFPPTNTLTGLCVGKHRPPRPHRRPRLFPDLCAAIPGRPARHVHHVRARGARQRAHPVGERVVGDVHPPQYREGQFGPPPAHRVGRQLHAHRVRPHAHPRAVQSLGRDRRLRGPRPAAPHHAPSGRGGCDPSSAVVWALSGSPSRLRLAPWATRTQRDAGAGGGERPGGGDGSGGGSGGEAGWRG